MTKTFHFRIPTRSLRAGVIFTKTMWLHTRVPQASKAAVPAPLFQRRPCAQLGPRVRVVPTPAA